MNLRTNALLMHMLMGMGLGNIGKAKSPKQPRTPRTDAVGKAKQARAEERRKRKAAFRNKQAWGSRNTGPQPFGKWV